MRNKKLFDKTISILVNAYLKEELVHGDSCACAIGNLIAGNNNYSFDATGLWITTNEVIVAPDWTNVLCNHTGMTRQLITIGYTLLEVTKIESAFESVSKDPTGYLGLMQVVDVLIKIHQGTEHHKKEAKELFNLNFN